MNMKLLAIVKPPYIYHGCSAQNTFWEGKFTPVNMKIYGRHHFSKHRDINNSEQ